MKTVRTVGSEAALERFRRAYPDLGTPLSDLKEAPFPPSLEVVLKPGTSTARRPRSPEPPGSGRASSRRSRKRSSRAASGTPSPSCATPVSSSAACLTLAAVLSVASAVRLALDLHRDEVGIMRLMGATESAIRAPFWLYATAEGLIGGGVALGLLYATYRFAAYWLAREPHPVLAVLWVGFLSIPTALLLPAAGAAAGLIGSMLSLGRRETRRATRIV